MKRYFFLVNGIALSLQYNWITILQSFSYDFFKYTFRFVRVLIEEVTEPTKYRQVIWNYRAKSSPIHWITANTSKRRGPYSSIYLDCNALLAELRKAFKQRLLAFDVNTSDCTRQGIRLKLRLIFNSDGVIIRIVERYDLAKFKSTESEAEHRVCSWLHRLWSSEN